MSAETVFAEPVTDAETGETTAAGVEEEGLVRGVVRLAHREPTLEGLNGFWPEGTTASLAAFARESDLVHAVQAQIVEVEVHDLAHARAPVL